LYYPLAVDLFVPVCSIVRGKRGRFFWAAWWTAPPRQVPFRRPDASDGGAPTFEEALARATERAGVSLGVIDPLWARAWMRVLRGEPVWPSRASREPSTTKPDKPSKMPLNSVWELLGIGRDATEEELKAAYRKRVLESHPDQGGDEVLFRQIVHAYAEAQRRLRKPKKRKKPAV
jgi:hypothetical protein